MFSSSNQSVKSSMKFANTRLKQNAKMSLSSYVDEDTNSQGLPKTKLPNRKLNMNGMTNDAYSSQTHEMVEMELNHYTEHATV